MNKIKVSIYALLLCLPLWMANIAIAQAQNETSAPITPEGESVNDDQSSPTTQVIAPIQRVQSPANTQAKMQLLAENFDAQSAQWLDGQDKPFFALWQEDRSGNAKGALLIIHAEGEHPSWPQTTKPLHDSLPDYGWATMAINLPETQKKSIPKRTFPVKTAPFKSASGDTKNATPKNTEEETTSEDKNNSEENAVANNGTNTNINTNTNTNTNKEDPYDPEVSVEEALTQAIKFLHDKGQFNIVILGSGAGAIRAHTFMQDITPVITDKRLKDRIEKPIRALILFNARNQLPTDKELYTSWFFDPEIPVLDIYTIIDPRNIRDAKARRILSKQKRALTYSQAKIAELPFENSWGENRLSRRIRNFLDVYVQGVEVENAQVRRNP